MKTILFQGDSITDCGRKREEVASLGPGYPNLVAARLGFERPNQYTFINKGISGNRSVDIYARIKQDILNLKPDVVSFLFGVNDVWHEINFQNGIAPEKFEKIYRMLLDEVKEALPETKIFLMEPYVLRGAATENTADIPNKWKRFSENVPKYAAIVDEIGEDYALPVAPLYRLFNEAFERSGNSEAWTRDGVHPSPAGHELIAREWVKIFETL